MTQGRSRLGWRGPAAAIIAVAFCGFVEWYLGWGALLRPWRALSLVVVAAPALLLLLTHAARAMRVHACFGAAVRGRRLACLALVLRHNLLNTLLPMRAGELGFPVLMARRFGVTAGESVPALLWFRALDLHSVLLFAGMALWPGPGWLAAAPAWLGLPWLVRRHGGALVALLARPLPGVVARLAERVLQGVPHAAGPFARIQAWTVATWGVKLAVFAWVLMLFAPLDPGLALLGAIGGELTSVLPVHGIAGLGTYEAGVVAALAPGGGEPAGLVSAAVNLHLFVLGVSVIAGALAWVPFGRRAASRKPTDRDTGDEADERAHRRS